jgi:hypothetical protein
MSNQGQKCNRTACNNQDAQWFNHSTQKYYCAECAAKLNEFNNADAMLLYGHPLCTLVETRLVSPNDMIAAAKKDMLEGREPQSHEDWLKLMDFCVVNVRLGVRESCCRLLNMIFDMGISDKVITKIIEFHQPFAVQISLRTGDYTITDGKNLMIGQNNMNAFIVVSKHDDRKTAEEFAQSCNNHPQRQYRFTELLAFLG